jgi:hypothetical protein
MAKKLFEEKDKSGKWRVWVEITDEGAENPEAEMLKFGDKKPNDQEIEDARRARKTAIQERKEKEALYEQLKQELGYQ